MYSYSYDPISGGVILNSTPTNFSKEPRPVYAPELDMFGFDKYWDYDKQADIPYMWAESTAYWYRGIQIAKIKGGNLYDAPELQVIKQEDGSIPFSKLAKEKLEPIDIPQMCQKNKELLTVIENSTVKKIVKEYEKFKDKLDIFHVAFSGGKDSSVLLDIIKKALPLGSFVVIFGDTGMEFPDTYKFVEVVKAQCKEDKVPFYISKSHLGTKESWELFGPPSKTLRWCCSVHKSTPQTLKLRELTGKDNYTGLDFVGVRKHESIARSAYEYENYGKKQKGQYSFYPILEWTSAEIWLYIFSNGLIVNEAYKKGNSRVGCLLCPMSDGRSDYARHMNYTEFVDQLISIIRESNEWDSDNEADALTYITSGGWINRRSGRGLRGNSVRYKEEKISGKISFELINPISDWREWIKTAESEHISYKVKKTQNGVVFTADENDFKKYPSDGKYFRQALRKAAYCVGCKVCEINCKSGRLKFKNGNPVIIDCIKCHDCHDIPSGCLAHNSLKIPQGEKKMKTINIFEDHAPKREWFVSFFDLQERFFTEHTLGPNMFSHFKRFLRDAGLIDKKNKCTAFSNMICRMGWDSGTALGLMLTNLAYNNAQFEWYINNMTVGTTYDVANIKERLLAMDLKEKAVNSIIASYNRIVATPFGAVLKFGFVKGNTMVRTKCSLNDNRVILYAIYQFAEKCDLNKEFNVSYLCNDNINRNGVSPVQIFGLYDEENLKSILLGLSASYPDFINATYTNDLRTISLRNKTADDVLRLFEEGY